MVIAAARTTPRAIAFDELAIYWAEGGDGGTIFKLPRAELADGGAPEELAKGVGEVSAIAATGGSVYWSSFGPAAGSGQGTVTRASRNGGAGRTELVGSLQNPTNVSVIDNADVYYAEQGAGRIGYVRTDGTQAGVFATTASPRFVVAQGAEVFWAGGPPSSAGLFRQPRSGDAGAPVAVAAGFASQLVVDSTKVYYTLNMANEVGVTPKDAVDAGGAQLATSPSSPTAIDQDATRVYWTAFSGGALLAIEKTSNTMTPTKLVENLNQPNSVAVDAEDVYFTARGGDNPGMGLVLRLAK